MYLAINIEDKFNRPIYKDMKEKYYQRLIKTLYPERHIEIKSIENAKNYHFVKVKMKYTDHVEMRSISETMSSFLSENIIIYRA